MTKHESSVIPLPNADESEKALLSLCLQFPDEWIATAKRSGVRGAWFKDLYFGRVFEDILDRFNRGRSSEVNHVILTEDYDRSGLLQNLGGIAGLMDVMTFETNQAAGEVYIRRVHDAYTKRKVLQFSEGLRSNCYSTTTNSASLYSEIETGLGSIRPTLLTPSLNDPHLCRDVFELPCDCNPETVVLGDEWLRRGDVSMLVSQAGAGKSVGVNGGAMMWSIGLPYLGIKPSKPLRVSLFVSEDDRETIGQQRQGLVDHFEEMVGRPMTVGERALMSENLQVDFSREYSGELFITNRMEALAAAHKADLVIINPLMGYVGGNIVEDGPRMLRDALLPALQRLNAASLIAHHTNKLGKDGMSEISQLYAGTGGAEMANIPRGLLILNPTHDEDVFRLRAEKRKTVGWKDEDGNFVGEHFVRRSGNPKRPVWIDLPHNETASALSADGPGPKAKCTGLSVRNVFAAEGVEEMSRPELLRLLCERCECAESTAKKVVRGLIDCDDPQLRVVRTEKRTGGGRSADILALC